MQRYRPLDHTADIRLRIYGRTFRHLLQNAVYALTDTLTSADRVRAERTKKVTVRGDDPPHLLILLLKEVLFLFETRRFLSRQLVIRRFGDTILTGTLRGEILKDHPMKTEIKAVTYHGLKLEKKKGRWVSEVVVAV